MTRSVTLLVIAIGIFQCQSHRCLAAIEITATSMSSAASPGSPVGLGGLLVLNQAVRGTQFVQVGARFGAHVPTPGLLRDTRIAEAFVMVDETPIAESQVAVAVEPLVDSIVVPEPMSATIWLLIILAALCGPHATARACARVSRARS